MSKQLFPLKNSDRTEVIERSRKSMDKFGWNYGGQVASITKVQLKELAEGKILAMDVNGGEYTQFVALADKELTPKADDPVSDLVADDRGATADVANPPSDPKRKANT